MANQSLDNNEVLNVRWAYEDPDPLAKERIKKEQQQQIQQALEQYQLLQAATKEQQQEQQPSINKKIKIN